MTRIIHCLGTYVTYELYELNFFKPGDLVVTTVHGKKYRHFIYEATFKRIQFFALSSRNKHSTQNRMGVFVFPFTIYRVMEE